MLRMRVRLAGGVLDGRSFRVFGGKVRGSD